MPTLHRLLAERQPVSWPLYQHCIQFEKRLLAENPGSSLKHLRELYQQALLAYGSTHPGKAGAEIFSSEPWTAAMIFIVIDMHTSLKFVFSLIRMTLHGPQVNIKQCMMTLNLIYLR